MRKQKQLERREAAVSDVSRCAALGVLLDALEVLTSNGILIRRGKAQAAKVERWATECLKGLNACLAHRKAESTFVSQANSLQRAVRAHYPLVNGDGETDTAYCSRVVAVFVALHESQRLYGMPAPAWRWLMRTLETLVQMIFQAAPEHEERMCNVGILWCDSLDLNRPGRFDAGPPTAVSRKCA